MKHVKFFVILISLLAPACGTFNVGDSAIKDEETGDKEEQKKKKDGSEITVETETTTKTKVTVNGEEMDSDDGGPYEVARYELRNKNLANTEFIGKNYCAGSELRDCWIRSGYMTEYSDGRFSVSIEFWDTYEAQPYSVEEVEIEQSEERAVLLTDKAKTVDDETLSYKMLWAVILPTEHGVAIIYDWGNDGPNVQGDDMLDALTFYETDADD